jgi:2-aminoethylphosphonate-pyruvate transaminase
MLSPGVKQALCACEISHRDRRFKDLLRRLARNCRALLGAGGHRIAFLSVSATLGIEAALSSVLPPGSRVLVLANGTFGARLGQILASHGILTVTLDCGFGKAIDLRRVERALADGEPTWDLLAMVHHETSAGILNPVAAVGGMAKRRGVRFFVDATSSAGAEELDLGRDGVDVCVTSSGKGLHGVPGLAVVCVVPGLLAKDNGAAPPFGLDVGLHVEYLDRLAQTPFTPSMPLFTALDRAVEELLAESVAGRRRLYLRRRRAIVAGAGRLGMHPLPLPRGAAAASLVTLALPRDIPYEKLSAGLRARGFVVYGCKPPLRETHFQVAVMGELSDEVISRFVKALGDVQVEFRAARSRIPSRRSGDKPASA